MRIKQTILALLLCQSPLLLTAQTAEDETNTNVSDSVVVKPQKKIVEDNNINPQHSAELSLDKTLPEVRFVTMGVSVAGGAGFYRSTPSSNGSVFSGRFGLNFDIPIGHVFSIQPELLFGTRGGGFDISTPEMQAMGVKASFTDHLFYADLPINLKFSKRMHFGKLTGRGFVSFGPQLSLGLGGRGKEELLGETVKYKPFQTDTEAELEDPMYENFEFGANFRLGFDTDKHISVALGYQMGFTEVFNEDMDWNAIQVYYDYYGGNFPSIHTNAVYLQIGYNW